MPETKEEHAAVTIAPDASLSQAEHLPAVVVPQKPRPARRRRHRRALWALVLLLVGAGVAFWRLHPRPTLPPGFASGNGRLEADEIDIDTKFAGRIAELRVDEGDMVKAGQVVAVMDTRDLQAELKQNQQLVQQDQRMLEQAKANYASEQAIVKFDQQEVARSSYLVPRGYATQETLDLQTQNLNKDLGTLNADEDAIGAAQHALDAATHQVEFYAVEIADDQLFAPKDGPIEYRVANVAEVLPAGGKIFTMLDASYVYMDIYLPTEEAGRIRIGSDARIVLDAYPNHVIPAKVVFIASQAQFTPKMVETKDERDKLMFRIRVRIDPQRLEGREAIVRTGLPGVAYVRTSETANWPVSLNPSPPSKIPSAVLPMAVPP
jgi:HlyD family secretion protein